MEIHEKIMKKIIFDFDGTLIDSRRRLYELFTFLEPDLNLSFDGYWKLKRNGISHKEILNNLKYSNYYDNSSFEMKWMELIEDEKYLSLDTPFDGVQKLFDKLKKEGYSIILLTARQFPEKVHKQLDSFGWNNVFSKILVTQQKYTKTELLFAEQDEYSDAIMVGDTGKDILTGKEIGAYSIAVLSGFLSKKKLKKYKPDEILNCLTDLYSSNFFSY